MEVILSILVALQILVAGIWYPQAYVDQQIHEHKQEIDAYQADEAKMQQLKRYTFKQQDDRIIVVDPDEHAD